MFPVFYTVSMSRERGISLHTDLPPSKEFHPVAYNTAFVIMSHLFVRERDGN